MFFILLPFLRCGPLTYWRCVTHWWSHWSRYPRLHNTLLYYCYYSFACVTWKKGIGTFLNNQKYSMNFTKSFVFFFSFYLRHSFQLMGLNLNVMATLDTRGLVSNWDWYTLVRTSADKRSQYTMYVSYLPVPDIVLSYLQLPDICVSYLLVPEIFLSYCPVPPPPGSSWSC